MLVALTAAAALFVVQAQNPQTTISIDAAAARHPISKYVYGLAYAGTAVRSSDMAAITQPDITGRLTPTIAGPIGFLRA